MSHAAQLHCRRFHGRYGPRQHIDTARDAFNFLMIGVSKTGSPKAHPIVAIVVEQVTSDFFIG
jgi:hypothetical protein